VPVSPKLRFRRVRAGGYAADVGTRVYFIARARWHAGQKFAGWELTAWCADYTDDVVPVASRTKAGCVAAAQELERARVARAASAGGR
jgi:hypothetical protein